MRAACILCRSRPPIENSHVIPKFAIRRLKAGNPIGTLVFSNDLNRVAQDGWKGDFLCNDCEQDFSRLETWFCREVYDPFLKTGSVKTAYGEELGLFGASVAFRYVQLALENNPAKQEIKLIIGKDGKVNLDVAGVKGSACQDLTKL